MKVTKVFLGRGPMVVVLFSAEIHLLLLSVLGDEIDSSTMNQANESFLQFLPLHFDKTKIKSMKIVPLFKVSDMQAALNYYTGVLDFVMTWPEDTSGSPVVDLGHDETLELQITTLESERLFGSVANVWVEDIDALFDKYKSRGLSGKPDSPVHQQPIDQTWGRREFYATDPDGNTLRFVQPLI